MIVCDKCGRSNNIKRISLFDIYAGFLHNRPCKWNFDLCVDCRKKLFELINDFIETKEEVK